VPVHQVISCELKITAPTRWTFFEPLLRGSFAFPLSGFFGHCSVPGRHLVLHKPEYFSAELSWIFHEEIRIRKPVMGSLRPGTEFDADLP